MFYNYNIGNIQNLLNVNSIKDKYFKILFKKITYTYTNIQLEKNENLIINAILTNKKTTK
jgi:hypothetical protein